MTRIPIRFGAASMAGRYLMLASLFASSFASVAFAQEKPELWYGMLDGKTRHFRFLVELTPEGESWAGTLKSLDEGRRDFQLSDVVHQDGNFQFAIKASGAKYEGKLDKATGLIDGKWIQRTASIPIQFKKVEAEPKQKLKAVWRGSLKILFQDLDMQVRELESGEVYFDSIKEKVGGFVCTKTVKDSKVVIKVPMLGATFEGELSEDGEQLAGVWKQNLLSPKLTLKKVDHPAGQEVAEAKRPQTPKGPFPYDVENVTFENSKAGVRLSGTLTLPKSESPVPAVLLISGSGPQDRDETIMGHKPFAVIADHFTRNGIAVLRYDERGVGKSTGDFSKANSIDLAGDATAGLELLKSNSRIDPAKIGICGHSEGGYVAPMIAAKRSDVSFVILMAGSAVTGERILVNQLRLILQASKMPEDLIERRAKSQQIYIDLAKQRPALSAADYKKQALEAIQEHLTEEEKELGAGETMVAVAAQQLRSPWFDFFIRHDPAEDLAKLKCSVLAINGSLDLQVDPKLNLPVIRESLQKAPTDDYKVVELPGLNHLFQNCKTGLIQEYEQLEETFDPVTLELMTKWVLEKTGR